MPETRIRFWETRMMSKSFTSISDLDLIAVAKHITTDFELDGVGVSLGLPKNEIRSVRTNNLQDINQAASEMLQIWKGNCLQRGLSTDEMKNELKEALSEMEIPTKDILP